MRLTSVFIGLSLIAACRGSSNKNPDGSTDTGGGTRIQDVQNDSMAPGTAVELHGVVVTAIDTFGSKTGNVWVEEPDGGPFSGVLIFGLPVAQLTSLAAGDIVDVTNTTKDEFAISGDTSGRTVTELDARMGSISKTGTGTIPAAVSVDALAIGQKATQAERDMEWEKWEGVLIKVDNITAFQAPQCIKSMGMCPDMTFESFSATGVMKIESQLANFPKDSMMKDTIKAGDCLASVTGIGDYAFDYLIQAQTLTPGGTGCAPREAGLPTNLCSDGTDNDGNGFSDCMDLGCEVGPNAWLGTSCLATDAMCGCSANLTTGMSANKVNTGTAGAVILNNTFITAVGTSGVWVADALQAAPNGGVFVFLGAAPGAGLTIGTKLATSQGVAGPFGTGAQKLIEISNATPGATSAGGPPLPLAGVAATALFDLAGGAQYAGSLVNIADHFKVTTIADSNGKVKLTNNAGLVVTMDDGAFKTYGGASPALNTCYTSLTGVMDLQTTDQLRTINPRSAADMVTGTGCN